MLFRQNQVPVVPTCMIFTDDTENILCIKVNINIQLVYEKTTGNKSPEVIAGKCTIVCFSNHWIADKSWEKSKLQ